MSSLRYESSGKTEIKSKLFHPPIRKDFLSILSLSFSHGEACEFPQPVTDIVTFPLTDARLSLRVTLMSVCQCKQWQMPQRSSFPLGGTQSTWSWCGLAATPDRQLELVTLVWFSTVRAAQCVVTSLLLVMPAQTYYLLHIYDTYDVTMFTSVSMK